MSSEARRVRQVAATVGESLAAVMGTVAAVAFIVLMLGGGVYRTTCTLGDGKRIVAWSLEGSIPYLWSSGDRRCETHTLTRFASGKAGLQEDIAR